MQAACGSVTMDISYKWLQDTEDKGMHTEVDQLTLDSRKMNGIRNIVSHVSNVNHWMMSHDNVWACLDSKHPAMLEARKMNASLSAKSADNSLEVRTSQEPTLAW
jgi:hypothetical protein